MENTHKMGTILAAFFIVFLALGFIKNGAGVRILSIGEYLAQDDAALNKADAITVSGMESDLSTSAWKNDLLNLNGAVIRQLNMRGFYGYLGMYIMDGPYIVSAEPYTTTDYEYEETVGLYNFLKDHNVNLLYVNEPTKYVDDSILSEKFGIESGCNHNADCFLSRIREAGVPYIDLRDNIREEGLDVKDLFYRTDHHWTTRTGLWAAKNMAEALNQYCGYDIDLSIYDQTSYTMKTWNNCWLGEQGRKMAVSYVGLDDFTEIKPSFETDYTFKTKNGETAGTFDNFVAESVYETDANVYDGPSWHYSYQVQNCVNNRVDRGKVLMLCDSYAYVTEPFLSLGVHEINTLIMREKTDSFHLRDYILNNGYDTVIIAYAQFMLGAHDNVDSANYRMYTFDH